MGDQSVSAAPGPSDVHLWCLPLVRPFAAVEREPLIEWLSEDERARHARFLFEPDRDQFLAAHALARGLLARALECRPIDLAFRATAHGRPELAGEAAWRFNLSHTRGLVTCALVQRRDIGVDVECRDRAEDHVDLARRFFAPEEADAIEQAPPAERRALFLEYWTLKEAYLKAVGAGLAHSLRRVAFRLPSAGRISVMANGTDESEAWLFERRCPTALHHLAVAVRREGPGDVLRLSSFVVDVPTLVGWFQE
ncbi:MAG TPA: 4'-phosphopantetheinyl transferase superfamily protein [Vicinamibacterales bacterium]|jgi:4'-phosphopantetheinyl transferase